MSVSFNPSCRIFQFGNAARKKKVVVHEKIKNKLFVTYQNNQSNDTSHIQIKKKTSKKLCRVDSNVL